MDAADTVLPAADIAIKNGVITAIGETNTLSVVDAEVIDCRGALVTPGLVNVHTHAATGFFRGLVEDVPADHWGAFYAVPGQEQFTLADYLHSARASCAEFLLNGVTCIADRWSNMDQIAPVLAESGIRAVVGQSLSDSSGQPDWKRAHAVLERFGVDPAKRVSAGVAPHALDSCSDALLRQCADEAQRRGCRVFVHVAQSRSELQTLRTRGYAGALACLVNNGLAGSHVVAAHAIYLSDEEMESWPEHGVSIAHCPASNIKIEARTLPLHRLAGRVAIGFGTDWAVTNNTMDLLSEARLASLVGKLQARDPTVLPVGQILKMLTIDAARALGLQDHVGSIEIGRRGDLAVFDLSRLEANPHYDAASNLLHSMSVRCVRDVLVDGEVLVRNGRLVRDDEAALAANLNCRGRRH